MTRTCQGCAGEIPATRSQRATYCSDSCRWRNHTNQWRAKYPEYDKAQSHKHYHQNGGREKRREQYQTHRYGKVLDDMTYKEATAVKRGVLYGYRSGLEETVAKQIEAAGKPIIFEADKINYVWPKRNAKYTPDFKLFRKDGSFFYVETKGRFLTEDRQKHILLKEQGAPEIRFVFSRSKTAISKTSKTTYAKWCVDHGFKYADKSIPDAWFNE